MKFWQKDGKTYMSRGNGAWVLVGLGDWAETAISAEMADILEGEYQAEETARKARIEAKYGPSSGGWNYGAYLDDVEKIEGAADRRRGRIPLDVEPADGEHEPWVAARMAARA